MTQQNPVGWFEIPVTEMDRAIKFYTEVFGFPLEKHNMEEYEMAWFPMGNEGYGATGALIKHEENCVPAQTGSLVYFSVQSGDLANELAKVEPAGGKIVVDKMSIGEHGFVAIFIDTEGNKVAMHSRN